MTARASRVFFRAISFGDGGNEWIGINLYAAVVENAVVFDNRTRFVGIQLVKDARGSPI